MIPRWKRADRKLVRALQRKRALEAQNELSLHGNGEAIELIEDPASSTSKKVKALEMLGGFHCTESVPAIVGVLENSGDAELGFAAASALCRIGSRQATRPLLGVIRRAIDSQAVFNAVYALWFLRDRRSIVSLMQVVESEAYTHKTRGLACEALGQFPKSLRFLLGLRGNPIPDIRCGALYGVAASTRDPKRRGEFRALLWDEAEITGGLTVRELAERIFNPK